MFEKKTVRWEEARLYGALASKQGAQRGKVTDRSR